MPAGSSLALPCESPPSSSSDDGITEAKGVECPICGLLAFHKHFGSVKPTCKGCSAFFRRTVVMKKSYRCRRNEQCQVDKGDRTKHQCQVCRFRRCLAVGMTINAVTYCDISVDELQGADTFLKKLVCCRNSTFTSRFKALMKIYGNEKCDVITPGFRKTANSYGKACEAEIQVLNDYIRNSGLLDFDDPDRDQFVSRLAIVDDLKETLSTSFFSQWMAAEVVYKNLKYMSYKNRRAYFIDDSYVDVNEDKLTLYYNSYNVFSYPNVVSQTALRTLAKVLEVAEKLYQLRISDEEYAICEYLLFLREAKRVCPRTTKFEVLLEKLFAELKVYYDKSFDNVPLRIGDLMIAMDLLLDVIKAGDDLLAMLCLSDIRNKETIPLDYMRRVSQMDFSNR